MIATLFFYHPQKNYNKKHPRALTNPYISGSSQSVVSLACLVQSLRLVQVRQAGRGGELGFRRLCGRLCFLSNRNTYNNKAQRVSCSF